MGRKKRKVKVKVLDEVAEQLKPSYMQLYYSWYWLWRLTGRILPFTPYFWN